MISVSDAAAEAVHRLESAGLSRAQAVEALAAELLTLDTTGWPTADVVVLPHVARDLVRRLSSRLIACRMAGVGIDVSDEIDRAKRFLTATEPKEQP